MNKIYKKLIIDNEFVDFKEFLKMPDDKEIYCFWALYGDCDRIDNNIHIVINELEYIESQKKINSKFGIKKYYRKIKDIFSDNDNYFDIIRYWGQDCEEDYFNNHYHEININIMLNRVLNVCEKITIKQAKEYINRCRLAYRLQRIFDNKKIK